MPVGFDWLQGCGSAFFIGLLEKQRTFKPDAFQTGHQTNMADISLPEDLVPDSIVRLAQVEAPDALTVKAYQVIQCDLAVAAASPDPVCVEAQSHLSGIRVHQHVMKLSCPMEHFRIVGVVGKRHPFPREISPQLFDGA